MEYYIYIITRFCEWGWWNSIGSIRVVPCENMSVYKNISTASCEHGSELIKKYKESSLTCIPSDCVVL